MASQNNEDADGEFALEIPDDSDISIEGDKLVIAGEEYPLANIKQEMERRAKENAQATVVLSSGGTTIGAIALGPVGGVAGAVIGSSLGYLIDKGYISWGSDESAEEVDVEEVVEDLEGTPAEAEASPNDSDLPKIFDEYDNRWYRPDSDIYVITVRTSDGGRAYFETVEGAKTRLEKEYE